MTNLSLKFPNGTKKKVELPKPIGNLETFRQETMRIHAKEEDRNNPNFFPCANCKGAKIIYDPQDPPDNIEGNKGRRKIHCPKCQGSGQTTKREFVALHKIEKSRRSKLILERKARVIATQMVLNRLTKQEWELIQNSTHI